MIVPADVAAALQAHLDRINEADPPDHDTPPHIAIYRHPCDRARQSKGLAGKGVSTAIDLKERYVTLGEAETAATGMPAESPWALAYAIIYREGKCKKCGQTARSLVGRAVETASRPPVSGRMARE